MLKEECARKDNLVMVSALTGEGVPAMLEMLEERLSHRNPVLDVALATGEGAELAWIYEHSEVLSRQDHEDGRITITARFDDRQAGAAQKRLGERLSPAAASD